MMSDELHMIYFHNLCPANTPPLFQLKILDTPQPPSMSWKVFVRGTEDGCAGFGAPNQPEKLGLWEL